MKVSRSFGSLLAPLLVLLAVHRCSGSIKCAIYVMDQPGNAYSKLFSGKEIMQPKIDCDSPDKDLMKSVCSVWFEELNAHWSLGGPSRSRGEPFTVGDDLCLKLKDGTFTFGAFSMHCDSDEVAYTGQERNDATLCCKDSAVCSE